MEIGGKTPKSQQRARIFDAYRGRGHKNNNLWLVYSVKTGRDWILDSDRKLIHWIRYLETDSSVSTFELTSMEKTSPIGLNDQDKYVEVWLKSGHRERHVVGANSSSRQLDLNLSPTDANAGTVYRNFNDEELLPHALSATRWLKAIAYAAAIRDQELNHVRLQLAKSLQVRQQGTLKELLLSTDGINPSAVIGMLIRAAIFGTVELDLSARPLGIHTPWRVRTRIPHVDT